MTVTIAERSLQVERREASLTRVSSVDAALQNLVDALRDGSLRLDPARYDLVVAAARNLLNLVARTGSGELDLLVDPVRGLVVRVRHDGVAATAEVVELHPPAPAAGTGGRRGASPAGPRPGGDPTDPSTVPGSATAESGRPLRRDVREDIARRRHAAQVERELRHELVPG